MPHGVLTVHFAAASPVMRSNLKIKLAPKTIADQHDHFEAFGFVDPAFVCDDYLPRIALWSHRNRYIGGPIADVLHLDPYTGLELSGRLGCLLHSAWSWFAWLRASRAQARKMFQHIGAVHKISGIRGFRARRAPSTCTPVIGTRRFFPLGNFAAQLFRPEMLTWLCFSCRFGRRNQNVYHVLQPGAGWPHRSRHRPSGPRNPACLPTVAPDWGRYVPDNSCARIAGHAVRRCTAVWLISRPSTPATPLLAPLEGDLTSIAPCRDGRLKSVRIANRLRPRRFTPAGLPLRFPVVRYRDLPEALLVPVVD